MNHADHEKATYETLCAELDFIADYLESRARILNALEPNADVIIRLEDWVSELRKGSEAYREGRDLLVERRLPNLESVVIRPGMVLRFEANTK